MSTGKVWLVGAGPGDAGLFTRKGYEVLQAAEVVVYDSLVGAGVLSMIPKKARTINVGKRASHHTMPQEEINRVLLEEAKKGYRVVRLKGGDPFLFGRGGEELELLTEEGIPYEVVPGVTSPLAVPAYNGIPVTHRDFTSSLHIITGHKKAGQPYDINFRALVETKGTLVFLMGVTALPDICENLLRAGMDPEMPAAILQKGTTARQKRIVATVATLPEEVKKQGVETPAIIVVGKVCTLADKFAWYEHLPLFGYRVLVTRPRELVSTMAEKLRKQGAEVLELPAIRTERIRENQRMREALEHLERYTWIAFTSPTGVRVFMEDLVENGTDLRKLAHVKIAAIGEGTKKALRERGLLADLIPEVYDGASLGEALAGVCGEKDRILLPRGKGRQSGDPGEAFRDPGRRHPHLRDLQRDPGLCGRSFSVRTGRGRLRRVHQRLHGKGICGSHPGAGLQQGGRRPCIGRQTRAAAEAAGMKTAMAEKATIDSVVDLVIKLKESR